MTRFTREKLKSTKKRELPICTEKETDEIAFDASVQCYFEGIETKIDAFKKKSALTENMEKYDIEDIIAAVPKWENEGINMFRNCFNIYFTYGAFNEDVVGSVWNQVVQNWNACSNITGSDSAGSKKCRKSNFDSFLQVKSTTANRRKSMFSFPSVGGIAKGVSKTAKSLPSKALDILKDQVNTPDKVLGLIGKHTGTVARGAANAVDDTTYQEKCQKAQANAKGEQGGYALDCYVDSYGRGVGTVPDWCDPKKNLEKIGLLCYPKCSTYNYRKTINGVEREIRFERFGFDCHQVCPDYEDGWSNQGLFCRKNEYGRGVGTPMKCGADKVMQGALCYDDCHLQGLSNADLTTCTVGCPPNFVELGITCGKQHEYGRGAGRSPCTGCSGCTGCGWGGCSGCSGCSDCSTQHCWSSEDSWGALCYPKCRAGFHPFGCCVCNMVCPPGMGDSGAFCVKPAGSYRAVFTANSCDNDEELNGALCYPRCRAGYEAFGCCICRPKEFHCSDYGLNDGIDISCAKNIEIGAVESAECRPGLEYDAGLCYSPCRVGFHGIGPVCWMDRYPCLTNCGAFYAESAGDCALGIVNMVFGPVTAIGELYLLRCLGATEVASEAVGETVKSVGKSAAKGFYRRRGENIVDGAKGWITSNALSVVQCFKDNSSLFDAGKPTTMVEAENLNNIPSNARKE